MDQNVSNSGRTMQAHEDRVRQWIAEGKDPATAHWQAALEDMLDLLMPSLIPGRLTPVYPLTDQDLSVFLKALEAVDLSPHLPAAFLPPAVAGKIFPPQILKDIVRIDKEKPSYKILASRPGPSPRILCAEISENADKPGVDIFQSGALLGTYDFQNQKDCVGHLTRIFRVHLWEREKWRREDHVRYTVNWFEKVVDLQKGSIEVETAFSFFHSPTLIKADRIDALFLLIFETIRNRLQDAGDPFKKEIADLAKASLSKSNENPRLREVLDQAVFELLALIRKLDLFSFETMTNRETDRFNRESARIIGNLSAIISP